MRGVIIPVLLSIVWIAGAGIADAQQAQRLRAAAGGTSLGELKALAFDEIAEARRLQEETKKKVADAEAAAKKAKEDAEADIKNAKANAQEEIKKLQAKFDGIEAELKKAKEEAETARKEADLLNQASMRAIRGAEAIAAQADKKLGEATALQIKLDDQRKAQDDEAKLLKDQWAGLLIAMRHAQPLATEAPPAAPTPAAPSASAAGTPPAAATPAVAAAAPAAAKAEEK
jgi:hypothetical protein